MVQGDGLRSREGIKSETRRFKNPDKKNLYEYRADGSITVVYPSTHPSGARYEWYGDFRESRRNRKVS